MLPTTEEAKDNVELKYLADVLGAARVVRGQIIHPGFRSRAAAVSHRRCHVLM